MMTLRHVNTRQCVKEAWAKVRQLTKARSKGGPQDPAGITAHVLNSNYAAVSTDSRYRTPPAKQTAPTPCQYVTETVSNQLLQDLITYRHGF